MDHWWQLEQSGRRPARTRLHRMFYFRHVASALLQIIDHTIDTGITSTLEYLGTIIDIIDTLVL